MATAAPSQAEQEQAAKADAFRRRIRQDPAWFFRDVLGAEPYPKQLEIATSVRDNEWTSVSGANSAGKDWMTGRLVPWWLMGWGPHAKVIVMAPTSRQVHEIVWRETRFSYQNSKVSLGGRMLPSASKWDIGPDWFALGFATDKPWNITGFHSPHLFVIISEAHNMGEAEYEAIKRLHPERLLLSGNPFSEMGEFYASHHEKSGIYHPIEISAFDTPNLQWALQQTDEETRLGPPPIPGVVSYRDVKQLEADNGVEARDFDDPDYGVESAFFQTTVMGKWVGRPDGLFKIGDLMAAEDPMDDPGGPLGAGVDVAGAGKDETVLTIMTIDDGVIIHQEAWRKDDSRGVVLAALLPWKDRLKWVNVDGTGIGYTWAFDFEAAGLPAKRVMFGASPSVSGEKQFGILKDEIYWKLRLRVQDHRLHGLNRKATAQLSSVRWRVNLHSKTEILDGKRPEADRPAMPSPDWAESTALAASDVTIGKYGGWQDYVAQELDAATRAAGEKLATASDQPVPPIPAAEATMQRFGCVACGRGTEAEEGTARCRMRLCVECYKGATDGV